MSTLRLVVVSVVCAVTLVAVRPAEACRGCTRPSLRSLVSAAPRVFAGKIVSIERGAVTVAVDTVWKGTVPATVVVPTGCRRARIGATLIYVPSDGRPQKWIEACLGVLADTARARARVTTLLGQPHPPTP